MGRICGNAEELIGNTPLVELKGMEDQHEINARLFAKLEYLNPFGSSKDRVAKKMLDTAEEQGMVKRGVTTIIEPTSGNTGVALAALGEHRGYRTMLVMPEDVSEERRLLLRARGAEIVLTEAEKGIKGAAEKAQELAKEEGNTWMPGEFTNPAGVQAHYETTGPEIWEAMDGKVDIFVCAVGTGGMITGVGRYLKEKNPNIRVVAVEPSKSAVLSGGEPGKHEIQGIRPGFVPEILDRSVYDEVLTVAAEECYMMCHDLAGREGILAGISSGAVLEAAVTVAERPESQGKNIVVVLPDGGDWYLTTPLFA